MRVKGSPLEAVEQREAGGRVRVKTLALGSLRLVEQAPARLAQLRHRRLLGLQQHLRRVLVAQRREHSQLARRRALAPKVLEGAQ